MPRRREAKASNKKGTGPTVQTATELWTSFMTRGGIQAKRARSDRPSYDHELISDVINFLGLDSRESIKKELERKRTPMEDLLQALLLAARPWSRMMTDILEMLQSANASYEGDGIVLELQLSKLQPRLAETLGSFRKQAEMATRVTGLSWGVGIVSRGVV